MTHTSGFSPEPSVDWAATRSVHSWISASQFILHHYCTTSIEALALDTPSYSIRPESFKNGEYEFPFNYDKL